MRTHELAKALRQLAALLAQMPDVELQTLKAGGFGASDEAKDLLAGIVAAQGISKAQLRQIIERQTLPVEVRRRDSALDVLGKLLKYFRDNPASLYRVRNSIAHGQVQASPSLKAALDTLLEGRR